jgi:hypothetical protein
LVERTKRVLTVKDLADHYGVSIAFAIRALAEIGVANARPDSALSNATINRFEARFGDRIRAKRLAPPPEPLTIAEMREKRRREEQARPHVIRVAYKHVTAQRGTGETIMADERLRGPAHAIDPVGTNDGEPWTADPPPADDAHHFYSHPGPPAACGVQVRVVMGQPFTAGLPMVCPNCVREFANGRAVRNPPGEYYREPRFCEAYIRIRSPEGVIRVEECRLRNYHDGRHETQHGATWETGPDDCEPPPVEAD